MNIRKFGKDVMSHIVDLGRYVYSVMTKPRKNKWIDWCLTKPDDMQVRRLIGNMAYRLHRYFFKLNLSVRHCKPCMVRAPGDVQFWYSSYSAARHTSLCRAKLNDGRIVYYTEMDSTGHYNTNPPSGDMIYLGWGHYYDGRASYEYEDYIIGYRYYKDSSYNTENIKGIIKEYDDLHIRKIESIYLDKEKS